MIRHRLCQAVGLLCELYFYLIFRTSVHTLYMKTARWVNYIACLSYVRSTKPGFNSESPTLGSEFLRLLSTSSPVCFRAIQSTNYLSLATCIIIVSYYWDSGEYVEERTLALSKRRQVWRDTIQVTGVKSDAHKEGRKQYGGWAAVSPRNLHFILNTRALLAAQHYQEHTY